MKSIYFLFVVGLSFGISCASKNKVSNMQIIESNDTSLTLHVNSPAPEYAAIHQLLFRGFPGSNQTYPLISTSEEEIKRQHPDYFKNLMHEKRYQTFITSSSKNEDGSFWIIINTKALKLDLEQNSVIRKFGY